MFQLHCHVWVIDATTHLTTVNNVPRPGRNDNTALSARCTIQRGQSSEQWYSNQCQLTKGERLGKHGYQQCDHHRGGTKHLIQKADFHTINKEICKQYQHTNVKKHIVQTRVIGTTSFILHLTAVIQYTFYSYNLTYIVTLLVRN